MIINHFGHSISKETAIASESISALEKSVSNALGKIQVFASNPEFASKMGFIFGKALPFSSLNTA